MASNSVTVKLQGKSIALMSLRTGVPLAGALVVRTFSGTVFAIRGEGGDKVVVYTTEGLYSHRRRVQRGLAPELVLGSELLRALGVAKVLDADLAESTLSGLQWWQDYDREYESLAFNAEELGLQDDPAIKERIERLAKEYADKRVSAPKKRRR